MVIYDFSHFDWINFFLLLATAPLITIVCYRVLPPRFSLGKSFLIALPAVAVISALNVAATSVSSGMAVSSNIAAIIEFLSYFLLWLLLAKDKFWKVLLFYLGWVIIIALGFSVGNLAHRLFDNAAGPDNLLDVLMPGNAEVLFSLVFQAFFCTVLSRDIAKRIRNVFVDIRWSMFSLCLLTQVFSIMLIAGFLTWKYQEDTRNMLLLLIYTMLCVLTDIYMQRTLIRMVANAELEQRVALLNQQQALEDARYAAANEQMQKMRRLRHDYINTLSTIGTLLSMGEMEKLTEILHSTSQMLDKTHILRTGNQTVDAVLYSKQLSAEQKGTVLRAELLWPSAMAVSDTELMRIFANLLDNAINYCETLPESIDRSILITSALQGSLLALRFSNPFIGNTPPVIPEHNTDDPFALHGHGLAIVREIAEVHGGTLIASVANGTLTFTVLLSVAEMQPPTNA